MEVTVTQLAIVRDDRFGRKHVCAKCGARFYDLKRPEPACPKCGKAVPPDSSASAAASRSAAKSSVQTAVKAQEEPHERNDSEA